MRRALVVMAAFAVCLLSVGQVMAADNDSHTVTVQVSAINELAISGGNVTLAISSATPGSEPNDAADNTTCDLAWTTNEQTKKITVQTNLGVGVANFTLRVTAQNVVGGSAEPEVTVSTTAGDFVTGVSETVGSCDLSYRASATAADGTGSDVHTITYTIVGA